MSKKGPLLRLVQQLDPRRARGFVVRVVVEESSPRGSRILVDRRLEGTGPRAYVLGSGERVDVALPQSAAGPGVVVPIVAPAVATWLDGPALTSAESNPASDFALIVMPDGPIPRLRILALHPDGGVIANHDVGGALVGGVEAPMRVRARLERFTLTAEIVDDDPPISGEAVSSFPRGGQLAFGSSSIVDDVKLALSSIAGPDGGHAIPALVDATASAPPEKRLLVLRGARGVHKAEVYGQALAQGILIGRSRRCALGRGILESDGLSRLHALVVRIDGHVWALDLASRYGLREVAHPSRAVSAAQIDNGVGVLVYGAGHLLLED